MVLLEQKRYLAEGLRACGLSYEGMLIIISALNTEEQVNRMIDWIQWFVNSMDKVPSQEELLKQAMIITGAYKETERLSDM